MAESISIPETKIETEISELVYVRRDDGSYGGWRTELLVEEITKIEAKFLLCKYCTGMLRDACLFEKDGKQEIACSICVSKDETEIIPQLNRDSVLEREVNCPLKYKSCDWTFELSELLHHLEECELFPVACPLGCRDEKGGVSRVERRGVETHRTYCPMRTVKCEYCSVSVKACGMNGHLKVCEEFPIPCPNKCSEEFRVKRKEKSIHLSQECPLQETECSYSQYGCEAKVLRRNLEQHEKEDMHKHMKTSISKIQNRILSVQKENEELRNEDLKLQSLIVPIISSLGAKKNFEWKISGVKNMISHKEDTFSDPFYVGLYKFEGWIKCDEIKDYVPLFLTVMKGEWDETLRWPIKYKSSLVLINQLDPENNYRIEFEVTDKTLEEEPKCFEKPKLFRNERCFGFPQFISQADILKEKYCKDDSIELNISVELV